MKIPYNSEVDARSLRGNAPQVSPDAFGASVGRGLSGLGQGVQRVAADANEYAAQQNAQQDAINVAKNDYTARGLALQNDVPPSGEGYAKKVSEDYDSFVSETADTIDDPNRRQKYMTNMLLRKGEEVSRAASWEARMYEKNTRDQVNVGLNTISNKVKTDPYAYDQAVDDMNALIDSQKGNANYKQEARTLGRYDLAKSRFDTMISRSRTVQDLNAVQNDLTNADGKGRDWTKEMNQRDYEDALNTIHSAAKNFQDSASATATAALGTLEDRNKNTTTLVSGDELQTVQQAVKAAGKPELAIRMARAVRDQNILREDMRTPPAALQEKINAMDAQINSAASGKPAQEPGVPDAGLTPSQVAFDDNQMRRRILDNARKAIDADPMAHAAATGAQVVAPLDGQGGFQQRGVAAQSVANYYSIPMSDMKPFTEDEALYLKKQTDPVESSVDNQLQVMAAIQTMGGESSKAAMKQIGEKDGVFSYAGSLYLDGERGTAAAIMRGRKMLTENPDIKKQINASDSDIDDAFRASTGPALYGVDPAHRQAIQDSALAYWIAKNPSQKWSADDYAASVQAVMGGSGKKPAVDSVNGVLAHLPKGVDASTVESAFQNMTVADYTRLSDNGLPPRYADGRVVDPADIKDEVTLRAIGGGKYHLALDDGSVLSTGVATPTGAQPYIFAPTAKDLNMISAPRPPGFRAPAASAPTGPTKRDVTGMVRQAIPSQYASADHVGSIVEAMAPTIQKLVSAGVSHAAINDTIKKYYSQFEDQSVSIGGGKSVIKGGTAVNLGLASYDDLKNLLQGLSPTSLAAR